LRKIARLNGQPTLIRENKLVANVLFLQGNAGERIRIYLVVGLALVLAALVYRHFKAKPSGTATLPPVDNTSGIGAVADLPPLIPGALPKAQHRSTKVKELRRDSLRDIFAPMRPLKKAEHRIIMKGQPRVSKAPSLKLKGVILGGGNPVAIINGKLLRLGESIDGYQVVRIGEKEVFLKSGNSTFRLELAKND
jgi:hypothetical protein